MNAALPEFAPRGKAFAVSRQSHVIGSIAFPVKDVVGLTRYELRKKAEIAAAEIDWRLNAAVILVDKGQ